MNPRRRAFIVYSGGRADRPTTAYPLTTHLRECVEKLGYNVSEIYRDPIKQVKVITLLYEETGLETLLVPLDLVVEAEALGCSIKYVEGHPAVDKPLFRDLKEFKYEEEIFEKNSFQVKYEAIKILREKYGHELPIINRVTGPVTMAGNVFNPDKVIIWSRTRRRELRDVLESILEINIEDSKRALRSGADIIAVGDPTVSTMPPDFFHDVLIDIYKEFNRRVGSLTLLHICGNTNPILKYIPETGFNAFSFDSIVSIPYARSIIGNRVVLIGNINNVNVLLEGSEDDVIRETIKAMAQGVDVPAPSCDIAFNTPIRNIRAMVRAIEGLVAGSNI